MFRLDVAEARDTSHSGMPARGESVAADRPPFVSVSDDFNRVGRGALGKGSSIVQHSPDSTGATREELRQDTDGKWYTRAEFVEFYGSIAEWEDRTRVQRPQSGVT